MSALQVSIVIVALLGYACVTGYGEGSGGFGGGRGGGFGGDAGGDGYGEGSGGFGGGRGGGFGGDAGGNGYREGSGEFGGERGDGFGEDAGGNGYGEGSGEFGGERGDGFGEDAGGDGYGGGASEGYGGGQNYPPRPYQFEYQIKDKQGNIRYRNEQGDQSGAVRGSYGYRDVQGLYRVVHYISDAGGFHTSIRTNEPGTDGKENPADVNIVADKPPKGIQDRYTRTGGSGYGGGYDGGDGADGHDGGAGAHGGYSGGAGEFRGGFSGDSNIRTNEPETDGKENPADVNIVADKPPKGIQDRYTRTGGSGYGGGYGGGDGADGHGGGAIIFLVHGGFSGGAGEFRGGFSGDSGGFRDGAGGQ